MMKSQGFPFYISDDFKAVDLLIYLLYREPLCSGLNERISKRSVHCKQTLFNNITKIIWYIDRYLHYQENPEEKKEDRRYTQKIEKKSSCYVFNTMVRC